MGTIIHFEGIPGSGKTTAAERFCRLLKSNGVDANWWLEEAHDHPTIRQEGRSIVHQQDFPQNCLDACLAFVSSSNNTVVFDGYALQSTVRFLYANCVAKTKIEDYFNKWQALAPKTALVYLSVENLLEHYELVLAERGDEWSAKLYNYVERTPVAVANGFQGKEGFVAFWSDYQQLCLELLDVANIPVHFINSRSWDDDDSELLAAKVGLLPT